MALFGKLGFIKHTATFSGLLSTCAVDDQVSCTFLVVSSFGGRGSLLKKSLANNWGDITFRESMLILFSWQTFILILIFLSTSIVFRHTKTWRFAYKFRLEISQPTASKGCPTCGTRRSNHWKIPGGGRVSQQGSSAHYPHGYPPGN